jgi:hypothetical protein
MKTKKFLVIGYPDSRATDLILSLQNDKKFFLNSITIGNTDHLEKSSIQIGLDESKKIIMHPKDKMDVLIEYKNDIIIDFEKNQQKIDFYEKYKFKHVIFPDYDMQTEKVIELINNI